MSLSNDNILVEQYSTNRRKILTRDKSYFQQVIENHGHINKTN